MTRKIEVFLCKYFNIHSFVPKSHYNSGPGILTYWDECKYCGKHINERWYD